MIKKLMSFLLHDYLVSFVEQEMSFQIQFVENGKTITTHQMYVVPQIGCKVDVNDRLFLVKDIIYSPYGSANKVIGKFI
ncbi:hypothetical protein [Flavobacterium hungaricum]|uniref:hypothetical protein n=1 Tax=Flavobacterium hungaricum TaxID=2082725 RepID=UPI0018846824|nr:hypothetical protein [Flavobacterium hungaricum]